MSSHTQTENAYRVLIVEDDRSQAQFAESIMRSAGISTQWVADAAGVSHALDAFSPDLVLMDMHLPDSDGAQLTSWIRSNPSHAHVQIVFLTGELDPERQYDALGRGADDFLMKPIRPRHLVTAIQNRIMRARAMQQAMQPSAGAAIPSLMPRTQALADLANSPAAMLLEVQNFATLRNQLGLIGIAEVMQAIHDRIISLHPRSAKLADDTYLILLENGDAAGLERQAEIMRARVAETIDSSTLPVRLSALVGTIDIAGTAPENPLHAVEHALQLARSESSGVATYQVEPSQQEHRTAQIRNALVTDGLELAFQPIVAVGGGSLAQFQVLLRMRDEHGELCSAGELIASARRAGLMRDIDTWVLDSAIRTLQERHDMQRPVRLFVSQSPEAITMDPAAEQLRALIRQRNIPEGALVIDLRMEDALLHSLAMRDFCNKAAKAGVRFCLSGYRHNANATALLQQLPLHFVRLATAEQDIGSEGMGQLRNAIADAHGAGLEAIGGQVDSPATASALWTGGVDYIQGNLIHAEGHSLDYDFQQAAF